MKKKQTTSLMIKAIMLLLALIIMVFAASLAWFAPPDRPVNATGLSVSTSADKEFDIAVGFLSPKDNEYFMTEYVVSTINLQNLTVPGLENKVNALSDFTPIDVTGDGATLVRPSMLTKNSDIDRTINTFTEVTPNKEYISYDLYFRASETCSVYLDNDSYAKGVCEEEPGDGKLLTDTVRKSYDGDFSKDAIVGAVRVAFVNYKAANKKFDPDNRNNEPSLLWLPRPDIHLGTVDENGQIDNPWALATGLTPDNTIVDYFGATDRYEGSPANTFTHHYYTYKLADDGHIIGDLNYENTVTNPNNVFICKVDIDGNDGYYYGKTQVNIWIEGCDAEARRTMSGGQFSINFDLAGS